MDLSIPLWIRKGDIMEKLSIAIVDYYIKHAQIKKEKREIYIYGFKLIFADIINFAIIILLGLCVKKNS